MIRPRVTLEERPGWEHDYIKFAKGARLIMKFYERRLFKKLSDKGRFLEIGPGPGYLLAEVVKRRPNLKAHGLDVSPIMLEHAGEVIKIKGVSERVRLDLGSAYDMPYLDEYFDFVFNMNTLHSIDQPEQFFREIARVLKPSGIALVLAWKRDVFWLFRLLGWFNTRYLRLRGSRLEGMYPLVNASYTREEMEAVLAKLPLAYYCVDVTLFALNIRLKK